MMSFGGSSSILQASADATRPSLTLPYASYTAVSGVHVSDAATCTNSPCEVAMVSASQVMLVDQSRCFELHP